MLLNILHSLVNIFAGGISSTKLFLFLIYLPLLVLIFFILRKKPTKLYPWKYFGFGLAAMCLYGFILQIVYVIKYHLPFFSFFVTAYNSAISSSSFNHTHIAKAAIGIIYSYFQAGHLTTADIGGAYLEAFPQIVFIIGSILILFLLTATIFYFITSFRHLLLGRKLRQQIFMVIGYAIASFSLIKESIDGGFFRLVFWVIPFFIWLFIVKEKKGKLSSKTYLLLLITGLIISASGWFTNFLVFYYFGSDALCQIGALFILFTALLYGTERKASGIILTCLILLIFVSDWPILKNDYYFYKNYNQAILDIGTPYYNYDYKLMKIKKEISNQKITATKLISNLGKNIYYKPISIPGITCREGSKTALQATMISKKNPGNIPNPSPLLTITSQASLLNKGVWQTPLLIVTDSCLPQPAAAIDGILENNGINSYILILK